MTANLGSALRQPRTGEGSVQGPFPFEFLFADFIAPADAAQYIAGMLVFQAAEEILRRVLGAFLLAYVAFLFTKERFKVPQTAATALTGGALYGLSAGIFGVGGAARGAFLAAYDLPKAVYIFTAGAIGFVIDSGRNATYLWQGAELQSRLLWALPLFVPISFIGAKVAERVVDRIPQKRFRSFVAVFLGVVALQLLILPAAREG